MPAPMLAFSPTLGIADVREVIDFGAAFHLRVFKFDEITDMRFGADDGARAEARKGADDGAFLNLRLFDVTEGADIGAYPGNLDAGADKDVGADGNIAADFGICRQKYSIGIDECGAFDHGTLAQTVLHDLFGFGKLGARVHGINFIHRENGDGASIAGFAREGDGDQ